MGLRHRSIRLRVGLLILVPVLAMLGLYGFAVSITLGSALAQAHAKAIRNDLVAPLSSFELKLAAERHDALQSLASPGNTSAESQLGIAEAGTSTAVAVLKTSLKAPRVMSDASAAEAQAISNLLAATGRLGFIRGDVAARAISIPGALADYNSILDAVYPVLDQSLNQQSNVSFVTQALDAITLDRAGQTALSEGDLLSAELTQARFPTTDRIVFAQLASQRQSLASSVLPALEPQYRAAVERTATPALSSALTRGEDAVIAAPWRTGTRPAAAVPTITALLDYTKGLNAGLITVENDLSAQAQHNANAVFAELILAAGLGLLGTAAAIALSLIIGRGLVGQLRELRESALTLAHDKLPTVISQLRAGEPVDIDEYAQSDHTPTSNEIEQVQRAFTVVQQTAVQSAVDEARLRRGISDVFRNLAGRSQSLLHRQLTLLDGMERRATEPEELDDLFRLDHLTTRMRRHAEGLIILSGETPARGWRQPVPLVDVLRAAVAEVEDYTRIRVMSRTGAAVAGHAVADVIHLIAELAENATVFSPPSTPVRIQGDIVGRGFAIEIEDRGLGISPARLEEINANLANPPQFDLSGSDRLGLFIAGQLALRHDIKVTLRPSVYGGTTAIVLLPTALVVEEDTFHRDPALPAGRQTGLDTSRIYGRHAAIAPPNGRTSESAVRVTAEFELDYSATGLAIGDRPATDVPDDLIPSQRELTVLASSNGDDAASRISSDELAELGLPVRVRQANLAPQLRDSPAAAPSNPLAGPQVSPPANPLPSRLTFASPTGSAPASSDPSGTDRGWAHLSVPQPPRFTGDAEDSLPPAAGSPEAARNTMSAFQRGWQLGRSEASDAVPDPPESTEPTVHGFQLGVASKEDPADGTDQPGTD
jgi:signal transduction histidine kinase